MLYITGSLYQYMLAYLILLKYFNFLKQSFDGAGEMTQWLRALTDLAEKQGSIPSTYSGTPTIYNFYRGGSNTLLWPPWVLTPRSNTHKHKRIFLSFKALYNIFEPELEGTAIAEGASWADIEGGCVFSRVRRPVPGLPWATPPSSGLSQEKRSCSMWRPPYAWVLSSFPPLLHILRKATNLFSPTDDRSLDAAT